MRNKVLKLFIHDDNNNNVLLAVFRERNLYEPVNAYHKCGSWMYANVRSLYR